MSLQTDIWGAKFANVAAQANTTHKTGPGILKRIVINKATVNGVLTVYDNTTNANTKIATITMPAALLASQVVLDYECAFSTGLTIVGSGADMDYTVVYV